MTWNGAVFGLSVGSALSLPGVPHEGDLQVELATAADIADRWDGRGARCGWRAHDIEGAPFDHLRGASGDHLFTHGDRATYHLSADRRTLLCAPADPADPAWRRVLLDSVLLTVALLAGHDALHAAAVAMRDRVIAIAAPRGAGKSTLAVELLRRGHALVADDVVVLTAEPGGVHAHPGPPVLNVPRDRYTPAAGVVLDTFGDEAWVHAHAVATAPLPLAALVVLERTPARVVSGRRPPPRFAELAGLLLGLGDPPGHRAARLDLLSRVASEAAIVRLEVGPCDTPPRLADAVEELANRPVRVA